MGLFREFLLIAAAGLGSAALGAGFGYLVGAVSPEFIDALAHPQPAREPERFGAALGMVCGLVVGAAAMVAGRLVGAARVWAAGGRRAASAGGGR
jgi:hypothetical protein